MEPKSSHNIDLNVVGGHVQAQSAHVEPEIAAASISPTESVIQLDGKSFSVDMDSIDEDKVELACNDHGCALIPDDGNPHNDIRVDDIPVDD